MEDRTRIPSRYDAVIVGVRVAGAATAMLLARAGLRVLALEQSAYASDTTSTHALMRAGVMQLQRWGVLDRIVAAGTPPIRTTTFHYGAESVEIPIQKRDGVDALYAPRRTVLDAILVDAARASGAEVVHGALAEELLRDGTGRVCGIAYRGPDRKTQRVFADIVIGADGASSRVARETAARVLHAGSRPGAYIYGYWRLPVDGTHWYFGNEVAAGVIPTNDGNACVFAGLPPARYSARRFTGLEALFQCVITETDRALARAIARAPRASKLHPFAGVPGWVREAWGPGWALVGDAGSFKDPLTAHGITDAVRDAELLANAVLEGTAQAFAAWQAERDAFAVPFLHLSDEIGSFAWDLERVKVLHHDLSRMMARECELVRGFDALRLQDRGGVPAAR